MANPWDNDPVVGTMPTAPTAAPSAPGVIYGRPKTPTPFEVEDQEIQRGNAARADRAEVRAEKQDALGTESERTAGFLSQRMANAITQIGNVGAKNKAATRPTLGVEITRGALGDTAANFLTDEDRQIIRAAEIDILDSALTLGTGAAYTTEQLEGYRQSYFPQLGDSPVTVAAKQKQLMGLLEAARVKAGRNAPNIDAAMQAFEQLYSTETPPDRKINKPAMVGDLPKGSTIQFGMDQNNDRAFNREAYLQERYGLTPNQEATAIAFWNANTGNQDLTPEAVTQWYSQMGMTPPPPEELAQTIQNAKNGMRFQGIDTTPAEQEYNARLDAELQARGKDPESTSGAVGIGAASGLTWGAVDEISGLGGAIASAIGGDNPVSGYRFERDLNRRELERAKEASPYITGGTEIASGLATGGVGFRGVQTVRDAAKAGAVTGALAGFNTGEGPVGSIAGAGIGAAAGGALAAGGQAAAPRIANAFSSLSNRVRPGRAVDDIAAGQEVIAAGERMDIPVRQADVRPEVRAERAQSRATERGGQIIREAEDQDTAAFEAALDRLGGNRNVADRFDIGDMTQNSLAQRRKETGERGGALYTRAREIAGDVSIAPRNALAAIDSQIAELEGAGANANRELISYLNDVKADLSRPGGLSIDALRSQRTNMRGQINTRNLSQTDAERRVGMVLDAASEDIKSGLEANPRAFEAFKTADDYWRTRAQFQKQIEAQLVGPKDNPISAEATGAKIDGWLKRDFKRARRLWNELPEENRKDIAGYVTANLGRNAKGEFSLPFFLAHTGNGRGALLSPKALRLVYGDDGVSAIKDLRALANAKVAASAQNNTSNTANAMRPAAGGLKSALLGALGFTQGGLAGGVALPMAAQFVSRLGEQRTARMLTNPDFTKWLRRLPESRDPAVIDRYFKQLTASASKSPIFLEDVRAFQGALLESFSRSPGAVKAEEEPNGGQIPPQQ